MDNKTSQILEGIKESVQHWESCRGLPIAVIVNWEDMQRIRAAADCSNGAFYDFYSEKVYGLKLIPRMDQEVGTFQMLGEL